MNLQNRRLAQSASEVLIMAAQAEGAGTGLVRTYTAESRRGTQSVTHALVDDDCRNVILEADNASDFAISLATNPHALSVKQVAWLHIVAQGILDDAAKPAEVMSEARQFDGIAALFQERINGGAKRVKLALPPTTSDPVRISWLSKNQSTAWVSTPYGYNPRRVYGKLDVMSGEFSPARGLDQEALDALQAFDKDPAGVARDYVQASLANDEQADVFCCFCCKDLTTKPSRLAGYGPVCAAKFGLPWGE